MEIVNKMLNDIEIPKFAYITQFFQTNKLENIEDIINNHFRDKNVKNTIKADQKIGITVGSRGITNLKEIVRAVCRNIQKLGAYPIIIPSMGSHGGATSLGQEKVLEELGITESFTGAKIMSNMEVEKLGYSDLGLPVYYDKVANNLDGVILLNRVKAHTDLNGDIESGLHKIAAIGLGNHLGATVVHSKGLDLASKRVKSIAKYMLENANILFGIAILENAYDETSDIIFLPKYKIIEEEPVLLKKSREQLPYFLFNDIDILIVDYIGKNISGDGMDPNIIGRSMIGTKNKEININKIVTLNLTSETMTNAVGVGLSDITTRKIYNKLEFEAMYANAVTAIAINGVRIPIVMDNDKKAIQLAIKVSCVDESENLRMVRIRDTLNLRNFMISEALYEDVANNPNIVINSDFKKLGFDKNDNLLSLKV